MEKVMTAQEKIEQEHNEIIERYHRIKKQQSSAFNTILVATAVIFFIGLFITENFLFAMIAPCVFAMFAFMGFLVYFLTEAPIAEGDYDYVMSQRGQKEC
jgi:hypothetical protein